MTDTEYKFKQVFQLAKNNGWNPQTKDFFINLDEEFSIVGLEIEQSTCQSLHHLVLATNFFDCLFQNEFMSEEVEIDVEIWSEANSRSEKHYLYFPDSIMVRKTQWLMEGSNALDWLFEQFDL